MHITKVGDTYDISKLSLSNDYGGAVFEGYKQGTAECSIILAVPDITFNEKLLFKKHKPKMGVFSQKIGLILLLDFKGTYFEMPFNILKQDPQKIDSYKKLPKLAKQLFNIFVVDSRTEKIIAIRSITCHPETNEDLRNAVSNQILNANPMAVEQANLDLQRKFSVVQMVEKTKLRTMGK